MGILDKLFSKNRAQNNKKSELEQNRPILLSSLWSILGIPSSFKNDQEKATLPEIDPIPHYIYSNWGTMEYPGIDRMDFASIPSVDENGVFKCVKIRKCYLDHLVNLIPEKLNLDLQAFIQSLIDGKRAITIGAITAPEPLLGWKDKEVPNSIRYMVIPKGYKFGQDGKMYGIPHSSDVEFTICHWESVLDLESIYIRNNFEMLINYCMNHKLDKLPPEVLRDCTKDFIRPMVDKISSKLTRMDINGIDIHKFRQANEEPVYFVNVIYSPSELKELDEK